MKKNYPRILYFINGAMPSDEAQEVAETYGPNVAFRNANFVPSSGALEKCDGVAGEVPETYRKLPSAEDALKAFENARKDARKKAAENKEKREAEAAAKAAAKAAAEAEAEGSDKKQPEADKSKGGKSASWTPNA